MRVSEGGLEVGPVSDRVDLSRMAGKGKVQVGLLVRFLARSMRASVLVLMVELEVLQVNMVMMAMLVALMSGVLGVGVSFSNHSWHHTERGLDTLCSRVFMGQGAVVK